MGVGVGSFIQPPIGAPPLVLLKDKVRLGSLALGKIKGLWEPWTNVLGGLGLFFRRGIFVSCVCVPICFIFPMKLI